MLIFKMNVWLELFLLVTSVDGVHVFPSRKSVRLSSFVFQLYILPPKGAHIPNIWVFVNSIYAFIL